MLHVNNSAAFGRLCFGVALILFGLEHFITGDFITGRAPGYPDDLPGKMAWAILSGFLFCITGAFVALQKNARVLLVICSLVLFVWALARHVPVLAAHFDWGGELTNAGKALTLFGGTLAVAASFPKAPVVKSSSIINQTNIFTWIGRICLGTFMVIGGIEHFIFVGFVKSLVPRWIPGDVFWTYFSAIALIAGGLGICIPKTASLAAILSGAMIFTWLLILHLPRAVSGWNDSNEWIAVTEALAFSGIAFVIAKREKSVTTRQS